MNPKLAQYISQLRPAELNPERKAILQPLISFLQKCKHANQAIRLNFICTHNSRRSHLSQIWAQTMAHYFGIDQVNCYSSGTEATAVYSKIIETLQAVGFDISSIQQSTNSVYTIKFDANEPPIIGFSKTIDAPFNPQSQFAAIMTCTQADLGCPFVAGASVRISLPFEDPKAFDQSPDVLVHYEERSRQIATELFYVFSQLKND
jgi:arsenate reductase